jgi:hypothetical protein
LLSKVSLDLNRYGNDRSKECFPTLTTSSPEISIFLSINKSKYSCGKSSPTTETIADCKLKKGNPIYVPAPPKILSVLPKEFQLRRKRSNNQ